MINTALQNVSLFILFLRRHILDVNLANWVFFGSTCLNHACEIIIIHIRATLFVLCHLRRPRGIKSFLFHTQVRMEQT